MRLRYSAGCRRGPTRGLRLTCHPGRQQTRAAGRQAGASPDPADAGEPAGATASAGSVPGTSVPTTNPKYTTCASHTAATTMRPTGTEPMHANEIPKTTVSGTSSRAFARGVMERFRT